MLILTRRVGQSIVIGDSIRLTIHDAGKSKVKIGIEAPPEVSIHREEIYQRVASENAKKAGAQT